MDGETITTGSRKKLPMKSESPEYCISTGPTLYQPVAFAVLSFLHFISAEFLKEHRQLEEQRSEFEAKFAQQQKQIETLTAGIQEISEQLKLTHSTR